MADTSSKSAQFTEVSETLGLDYLHATPQASPRPMTQEFTGGAAAEDFDGDGWVDLYVTRLDDHDLLFRNRGTDDNGTHRGFEDVTGEMFGGGAPADLRSNGAAWGDVDNDGNPDLYVTTVDEGRARLFMNNPADSPGGARFREAGIDRNAVTSGDGNPHGMGAAFGDYDRDGYLDLYSGEWVATDRTSHARLLRNRGNEAPGHFEDATVAAGVSVDEVGSTGTHVFAPRFTDLDHDGWPDLTLASDFGESRLFWNEGRQESGTVRFTDGTEAANVGTERNGMGSAVGDYDGDGRLDWFVTAIAGAREGNRMYRNNGDRTFEDTTDDAGVRDGGWGWGASFLDFNNNGDLDLVMTNGWRETSTNPEKGSDRFTNDQTRLWQSNGDGTFTEVATELGITDTEQGRGLLTMDYDRDGDLDVFIVNNSGQPLLYRNDIGDENNWLQIKPEGTISNRDGIGARITVWPDESDPGTRMIRELDGGDNFLSQSELIAHFGLGDWSDPIDLVRIEWPGLMPDSDEGMIQEWRDVNWMNQRVTIREGTAGPTPVPLPSSLTLGILLGVGALSAGGRSHRQRKTRRGPRPSPPLSI